MSEKAKEWHGVALEYAASSDAYAEKVKDLELELGYLIKKVSCECSPEDACLFARQRDQWRTVL